MLKKNKRIQQNLFTHKFENVFEMVQFLKSHKQPKLTLDEGNILNTPKTSKDTK